MENNYSEIIKHIPIIEDHGHLYMYYGLPYSDECIEYTDSTDAGNLIVSYECNDLCRSIAEEFEQKYKWHDILSDNQIKVDSVFELNVEAQEIDIVIALLLDLIESMAYGDKFIDALKNGYLIRLIKRLEAFS